MPAPEHLAPILDRIGDGGTVELAELVHQLMAEARADERGTAPAIETLQAQLDVARNDLAAAQADIRQLRTEWTPPDDSPSIEPAADTPWRLYRSDGVDQGYRLVLPEVHAYVISDRSSNDYQVDDLRHEHPDLIVMPATDATPAAGDDVPEEPEEEAQAVVARAAELADTPDDDIDWDDDRADAPNRASTEEEPATVEDGQARPGPSNADIRAWCQANDVPVNAKGAVRADARAAYDTAHQA